MTKANMQCRIHLLEAQITQLETRNKQLESVLAIYANPANIAGAFVPILNQVVPQISELAKKALEG